MNILSSIFKRPSSKTIDFNEIKENGAIVVDVRTPGEYKTGHVKASYNFPLSTLRKNIKILQSFHKPLLLVCRSGNRSETAKNILKEYGIECYNAGPWKNLN